MYTQFNNFVITAKNDSINVIKITSGKTAVRNLIWRWFDFFEHVI